jgi:hypothetical protein
MISQIMIFVLGSTALWLVGRPESWSRWGFVLGLCAQPFWYLTVIQHHQYGILALNICYTYSWIQGIYYKFYKK